VGKNMIDTTLTGIERELVVQYLIDGNVPVTITPLDETEKTEDEEVHPVNSQIFPVAIKGENLTVKKNGVIILENPGTSVKNFVNKSVKVEFYFNRVGLYFNSKVCEKKDVYSVSIPDVIYRINDVVEEKTYDFCAVFYYECRTGKDLNLLSVPWENVELFNRPAWKTIPLENQKKAKELLEKYVADAKLEKNAGNGIQLIPVCNYLTYSQIHKVESLQDRIKPLNILYVDHERIVVGLDRINYTFVKNDEYGLKLSFSLKSGPIMTRDIFVTCLVNKIYSIEDDGRICVDFRYTTIQEEDLRFIYEKATKTMFI
jgi:hypothetical protein